MSVALAPVPSLLNVPGAPAVCRKSDRARAGVVEGVGGRNDDVVQVYWHDTRSSELVKADDLVPYREAKRRVKRAA